MLAAVSSSLGSGGKDEMMQQSEYVMMNGCGVDDGELEEGFCDFDGNLLDSIDFDDLFLVGINDEEDDVLPDLEMDPHDNYEILAEFSAEESQLMNQVQDKSINENHSTHTTAAASSDSISTQILYQEADDHGDVVKKKDVNPTTTTTDDSDHHIHTAESEKGRKSSSKSSRYAPPPHGKRKVKVDWTPELHRRFVQAVEQLGVDKAVPSRILELMGIDCLTRHNIASHLQKYRSHRKHLLAREAEATSWTQKRRLYCTPPSVAAAGGKRDMNTWHAPTIGFPPMAPPMAPPFRPLHVWGHPPAANHPLMHVWPKHLRPSPTLPLPPTWPPAVAPLTPPAESSFRHSQHLRVPSCLTPCFPPNLMPPRYPVAHVPGIPPPTSTMYKIEPGIGVPTALAGQALPQPPIDFHPSKESIDAAIGDALSKPWLPLPLGLKPPSVDGVLEQLQRQGVPKIPPSTAGG